MPGCYLGNDVTDLLELGAQMCVHGHEHLCRSPTRQCCDCSVVTRCAGSGCFIECWFVPGNGVRHLVLGSPALDDGQVDPNRRRHAPPRDPTLPRRLCATRCLKVRAPGAHSRREGWCYRRCDPRGWPVIGSSRNSELSPWCALKLKRFDSDPAMLENEPVMGGRFQLLWTNFGIELMSVSE